METGLRKRKWMAKMIQCIRCGESLAHCGCPTSMTDIERVNQDIRGTSVVKEDRTEDLKKNPPRSAGTSRRNADGTMVLSKEATDILFAMLKRGKMRLGSQESQKLLLDFRQELIEEGIGWEEWT